MLECYPVSIIRLVTDPVHGIAGKIKWLPAVAEIKAACDAEMPSESAQWAAQWERSAQLQVAQRDQLAIEHQRPRKTYEQIKAEFAEIGIYLGKDAVPVDVGKVCEKYGISKQQWDAIPNRGT